MHKNKQLLKCKEYSPTPTALSKNAQAAFITTSRRLLACVIRILLHLVVVVVVVVWLQLKWQLLVHDVRGKDPSEEPS